MGWDGFAYLFLYRIKNLRLLMFTRSMFARSMFARSMFARSMFTASRYSTKTGKGLINIQLVTGKLTTTMIITITKIARCFLLKELGGAATHGIGFFIDQYTFKFG